MKNIPREKYSNILSLFNSLSKLALWDKEQDLTNPHFHNIKKGCVFENKEKLIEYRLDKHGKPVKSMFYKRCLTHNIDVCNCGWEFNWHYGTDSIKIYKKKEKHCNICENTHYAKGLCQKHYNERKRLKKYQKCAMMYLDKSPMFVAQSDNFNT